MKFQWAPGSRFSQPAQVVGEQLKRIEEKNGGRIEAKAVVKAARNARSPLHPLFEWDDAVAAELHRVEQARHIIRAVIVHEAVPQTHEPVRAFVNVIEAQGRGYTSVLRAFSDIDLRKQVLDEALQKADAWRRRYSDFEELADIFAAIDRHTG